jgi:TPR repeat protein
MRPVSYCLLATSALFAIAAAPDVKQTAVPATAAPPTSSAATAPETKAAAAVMLGAVATPDSKASGGITASSAASVKAGVEAWQKGNYAQAVATWQPLADKGDPDAQFNLGQAYKLGRGVPAADLKRAEDLYARAAAQGHEEARANLGIILFQNGDRARGMPYIVKAAEAGDARAQYIYGTALFNGDLVQKDWARAYAMMTKAAAAGLPQAAESLNRMDSYIPTAQRQQGIAMAGSGFKPGREPAKTVLASRSPIVTKPEAVKPAKPTLPAPVIKPVVAAKPAPPAKLAPAPKPAQVARPAPVPPAVRPGPIPNGQGWYVQLGAYSSRDAAVTAWKSARGKIGALAGIRGSLSQAGRMTRLRAGPVNGLAAATRLCAAASRAGQACFPAAP